MAQRGGTKRLRTRRKPLPGKNKTSETSGESKSRAFCFTESRCLLPALPPPPKILCMDRIVTPLSKKEAISTSLYCIYNEEAALFPAG